MHAPAHANGAGRAPGAAGTSCAQQAKERNGVLLDIQGSRAAGNHRFIAARPGDHVDPRALPFRSIPHSVESGEPPAMCRPGAVAFPAGRNARTMAHVLAACVDEVHEQRDDGTAVIPRDLAHFMVHLRPQILIEFGLCLEQQDPYVQDRPAAAILRSHAAHALQRSDDRAQGPGECGLSRRRGGQRNALGDPFTACHNQGFRGAWNWPGCTELHRTAFEKATTGKAVRAVCATDGGQPCGASPPTRH